MAYIVIDADGYYGDHAKIYGSYETLDAAIKACRRFGGCRRVTTDGGFTESHQKGCTIHRSFACAYRTVWATWLQGGEG